mmetsp:Transcript_63843/g.134450  ORF Transcript_63843/g.134450 Transcript_63843/m.134450 type:complete len:157 (+) Transcript_63843:1420-1890(+)
MTNIIFTIASPRCIEKVGCYQVYPHIGCPVYPSFVVGKGSLLLKEKTRCFAGHSQTFRRVVARCGCVNFCSCSGCCFSHVSPCFHSLPPLFCLLLSSPQCGIGDRQTCVSPLFIAFVSSPFTLSFRYSFFTDSCCCNVQFDDKSLLLVAVSPSSHL